jgi:hypothetical protein
MAAKRGTFKAKGLSALRRRWNVLRAVHRFRREPLGPSWDTYVRATQGGRKEFGGKKK